ncbi:type I-E CRISPR-associated protein Cas6/Cse3/CasE [Streptomonospora wellingtoniae]|uniref:Type I-E CRISPR-associated protein Cas6/Cse3/CasE n=1 Tax=Streptomonospora wellingtoniae TaxID=3075544 RepID=A0ABU2KNI5_9ACTN|nr:type I-E CRISPR-associated protein Cas6/Cse3/CasE [Streptomonospora sp. DSM 45055]MDT0300835.1 type I-E CRISPR-associated protein Cas6/Cse3/CasE [Streptomonospora sp. DSM 45055]
MTVWLTRIRPDLRRREARRDLASAVGMHHRLMSLFPDDTDDARRSFGVLFRVEDTETAPQILLQSTTAPQLERLPADYATTQIREITPLLQALAHGRRVHYRIAANPIRRPGRTTRQEHGAPAVVPLSGKAAEQWWLTQSEAAGIKVETLHARPLDAARGERAQDKRRIRHARTLFEGTAHIDDADLLRQRTVEGIGRGKAYGCGLLSLAPARGSA